MDKTDDASIRAVLSGDKEAYGALVARHSNRLFRIAYRITGNEADADEVVQDAFLRGYRKLGTFKSRADFGTWIYRIAARCAFDKVRNRKADEPNQIAVEDNPEQQSVQVADSAAGPERLLLSGEIGALQEMAMHGLTPIERTAFILRHIEEQSMEEIGEALGIAPNSAKQAIYRAVHKLRLRLAALRIKA